MSVWAKISKSKYAVSFGSISSSRKWSEFKELVAQSLRICHVFCFPEKETIRGPRQLSLSRIFTHGILGMTRPESAAITQITTFYSHRKPEWVEVNVLDVIYKDGVGSGGKILELFIITVRWCGSLDKRKSHNAELPRQPGASWTAATSLVGCLSVPAYAYEQVRRRYIRTAEAAAPTTSCICVPPQPSVTAGNKPAMRREPIDAGARQREDMQTAGASHARGKGTGQQD
ncbi:hypothetical protein B0H19DRAFT_1055281 [Mycena capillaripes]|nr:hypothetical protein B0H19DRAFT_1055281 [Mycena capillaripes]